MVERRHIDQIGILHTVQEETGQPKANVNYK